MSSRPHRPTTTTPATTPTDVDGLDRADVVAMLAAYGDREAGAVVERIDSLGLAWLVHQVEQRYGVSLDLDDEQLANMDTVTGAVEVLRWALLNPTED